MHALYVMWLLPLNIQAKNGMLPLQGVKFSIF